MKRTLLMLLLCLPFWLSAQQEKKGVQFDRNLSWAEIKAKAKQEGKYIFVDFYTTWCGPCKEMDKNVYPDERVGNALNDKFVSVQLQMDETKADDQYIHRWRDDAKNLAEKVKLTAYPTLVFFNPEGEIVLKQVGYKSVDDFLTIAGEALKPDARYDDPYREFDSLLKRYRSGDKPYEGMVKMIIIAKELSKIELADSLTLDLRKYLKSLTADALYAAEYIEFLGKDVRSSKDDFFSIFYPNGGRANEAMGNDRFSRSVVDRIIRREITDQYLKSADSLKSDPQWLRLRDEIASAFNTEFADRGVMAAKLRWFEFNQRLVDYDYMFMSLVEKYGIESLEIYRWHLVPSVKDAKIAIDLTLNSFAWRRVFNQPFDMRKINFALKYMPAVVERSNSNNNFWASKVRDTYANILYRAGKKEEAIKWEKDALKYALLANHPQTIKECEDVLNKMHKNQATWEE